MHPFYAWQPQLLSSFNLSVPPTRVSRLRLGSFLTRACLYKRYILIRIATTSHDCPSAFCGSEQREIENRFGETSCRVSCHISCFVGSFARKVITLASWLQVTPPDLGDDHERCDTLSRSACRHLSDDQKKKKNNFDFSIRAEFQLAIFTKRIVSIQKIIFRRTKSILLSILLKMKREEESLSLSLIDKPHEFSTFASCSFHLPPSPSSSNSTSGRLAPHRLLDPRTSFLVLKTTTTPIGAQALP